MWVGAGPQYGFAVRFPATPPWLPKQNAQQHQMWKKSPNEVGKPHEGFGLAFSELASVPGPQELRASDEQAAPRRAGNPDEEGEEGALSLVSASQPLLKDPFLPGILGAWE